MSTDLLLTQYLDELRARSPHAIPEEAAPEKSEPVSLSKKVLHRAGSITAGSCILFLTMVQGISLVGLLMPYVHDKLDDDGSESWAPSEVKPILYR